MVKVYAIALVTGLLGLLIVVLGGALADNVDRPDRDPGEWLGDLGKTLIGAVFGFGMGGLSAEFSPLDLSWQTALLIALGAAAASIVWVRYSVSRAAP
ncbi:MAG: hypothetical protein ACRDVL_00685 [Acidimicrobiia bacterium]